MGINVRPTKRIFGIGFIAFLTIFALAGIFILLLGNFGDIELKILATSLAISGYSVAGFTGAILHDRQRCLFIALSCMGISITGLLITIIGIWQIIDIDDLWRIMVTFAILAFALAHTSLLLLIEVLHGLMGKISFATLLCIAVTTAMLVYLVLFLNDQHDNISHYYYRFLGMFVVLSILGTIVIPIIRKVILSSK